MARNKRSKKHIKREKARRAQAARMAAARREEREAARDARRSELERALIAARDAGDLQTWARLLDELFPPREQPAQRLQWLLDQWPEQAHAALEEGLADDLSDAQRLALTLRTALGSPDAGWAALETTGWDILEEGARVRRAADAVARGDDAGAKEALRGLGLRSPLREARLLLRGLLDFRASRWQDARRAWTPLLGSALLDHTARTLLAAVGAEDIDIDKLSVAWQARLGGAAAADALILRRVRARSSKRQINSALSAAARERPAGSEALHRALRRHFVAALTAADLEADRAVTRVLRALPDAGLDPRGLALQALDDERWEDPLEARRHWKEWLEELRETEVPEQGRRPVLAAVADHIAEGLSEFASFIEDDDDCDCPACRATRRHPSITDDLRREALALLEEACAADPRPASYWEDRLALTRALHGKRAANRLLEEMSRQQDAGPEVHLRAARACLNRRAFDKGLKHAIEAAELEPLSRQPRELQVELLLGKARRKLRNGHIDKAEELHGRALAVASPGLNVERTRIAEAAALAGLRGRVGQASSLVEEGVAAGTGAFLQRAAVATAAVELGALMQRHADGPPTAPDLGVPEAPPPVQELTELLKIVVELPFDPAGWPPGLHRLLEAAVRLGAERLTHWRPMHQCTLFVSDPAERMRLARLGLDRYPDSFFFNAVLCSTALDEGMLDVAERCAARLDVGFDVLLGDLSTDDPVRRSHELLCLGLLYNLPPFQVLEDLKRRIRDAKRHGKAPPRKSFRKARAGRRKSQNLRARQGNLPL